MATTVRNKAGRSTPPPARMLRRGAMKRCPACGAGRLFSGWFRMADRCPGCGYQFAREEGFFLGAYVMTLAIELTLRPIDEAEPSDVRLGRAIHRSAGDTPR